MQDILGNAVRLALIAHKGQLDKNGRPYIEHVSRVAARVRHGGEHLRAVAWLHDTVEDDGIPLSDLHSAGFPVEVIEAVDAISRRREDDDAAYYRRVLMSPVARQVKRADIADNCDERRLALLNDESRVRLRAKYAAARSLLGPACHLTLADFTAYGASDLAWLNMWTNHPIALYEGYDIDTATTAISMTLSACQEEATVSPLVIGSLPCGCTLAGFAHRIKAPSAIAQRLVRTQHEIRTVETPKDLVRYTVIASDGSLWEDADSCCAELAKKMSPIRARHFFIKGNPYMGIHTWWTATNGSVVEIQFHSQESYRIKEETHDLYQIYRDPGYSYPLRREAFESRRKAWATVKWDSKDIPQSLGGIPLHGRIFPSPTKAGDQLHVRSILAD